MQTKTMTVDRTSRTCDIPEGFITGWHNRSGDVVTAHRGSCRVDFTVHENYVRERDNQEWATDEERWTLSELTVTSAQTPLSHELASEGGFGSKRRAKQFDAFLVKALNETIATNGAFAGMINARLCEALDNDRY